MASFRDSQTRDANDPWDEQGLPPGVPKAVVSLLGVLLMAAAPYVIPGAERFRVWTPEDPTPFAGMFDPQTGGPSLAHASGGQLTTSGLDESEVAALQATAGLDDDADAVDPPAVAITVEPQPEVPPGTGPATALVDPGAERPDAPPSAPARARIKVPEALYAGVEVTIEDPKGAMEPFYEALGRTARKEPGAITRVSHWGDSAIAADGMTSMTRRLLQRQFGDSGHGFMLIESGSDWYRQKDIRYSTSGWKALKIIDGGARDGLYGFGGVSARGYLGARASFQTVDKGPVGHNASRFEVHYLAAPGHGDLAVKVDDGEPEVVKTAADAPTDRVHVTEVPDGPHRFEIKNVGGGLVRAYGVVLERSLPGVVYDCLGLVGARGARLLNADPEHWTRQIQNRRPDLMVIMFGGNELVDRGMNMDKYRESFTEVVRRFRTARPEAACLVMSPLDHGERHRGAIRTDPQLLKMIPVQREVAFAEGCAFYSVFDAMGGEGSMGRWFHANPRLGWGDFAHATPAGARVLGDLFFKALMKGFADWADAAR